MSVKQQFAQVIESLPDSVSVEEAFERLYRAFKLKQMWAAGQSQSPEAASSSRARTLKALEELERTPLSPEEVATLDEMEQHLREHPFSLRQVAAD